MANQPGSSLDHFTALGFSRQLAATPGFTPEQRKDLTVKLAAQRKVRAAKFEKIRGEILAK